MVSFIISYILAVLSVRVQKVSHFLSSRLVLSIFFFSFFYANSLLPSLLSPRLSFSYIYEIEKHTSHIYVLQYSLVYLHFFFGRLINSRVSDKIYDCLKISFD